MGRSWSYTPIPAGYYAAAAKIEEIVQMGHRVGGDIARVKAYTG